MLLRGHKKSKSNRDLLNNLKPMARTKKYSNKAQSKIKQVMHEYKRGKLKSGKSGKIVGSRKQAIAIGLSEARKRGAKVPKKNN